MCQALFSMYISKQEVNMTLVELTLQTERHIYLSIQQTFLDTESEHIQGMGWPRWTCIWQVSTQIFCLFLVSTQLEKNYHYFSVTVLVLPSIFCICLLFYCRASHLLI